MNINLQLKKSLILHFSIAKVIQKLLYPITFIEFEQVMYQLSNTKLILFEIDDYVLSFEIEYDKNESLILNDVGKEICMSNKFELVVCTKSLNHTQDVLCLDFMHHELEFLIKEINSSKKSDYVPAEIIDYFNDLKFEIAEASKDALAIREFDRLISWAKECNIPEEVIPYSKEKLLALEVLDLSNLGLESLPNSIRLLKNLKELYLASNNLNVFPLEVCTFINLKKLCLQNNSINYIPEEINNLVNLEELMIHDNNIQKLTDIQKLKKLKFITLQQNRLQKEKIIQFKNMIYKSIDIRCNYQKPFLPFYIEKLSRNTLLAAKLLRDKIFVDLEDKEKALLEASLNKDTLSYVYKQNEIKEMQYWIARDKKTLQVIALTGLYIEEEDDEDSCWLGWFCLDERYRGKGFGKELFNFSIEQVKRISKRYLHIYTYNSKKYKPAIHMYKSYGFKEYNVKNTKYKRDLYFKKNIKEKNAEFK